MICKSFYEAKDDLGYVSFILTMWYVNIEYRYTYNMVVESFILTMWYVN